MEIVPRGSPADMEAPPDAGASEPVSSSADGRPGGTSPGSSPRHTVQGSVDDLPDLTGRLIKEGLHEEYLQYRARYLMWRQGGASGAVGELAELGTARRQSPEAYLHELWHPTPQKFDFFYTVSYWVAVVGVVGAMILTFVDSAPLVHKPGKLHKTVLLRLDFVGDLFFTLSTYLSYFELINTPETGGVCYIFPDWGPIRERVNLESVVGVVVYLLAMLLYDMACVTRLMPVELSPLAAIVFVQLPTAIGGLGFFVGGFCEVIHNWDRSWRKLEWWISVLNALAGFLFLVGGGLGPFLPAAVGSAFGSACFALGLVVYTTTSALLIVMWRSNDFGLTLLRQLNATLRAGAQHVSISPTVDGVFIRHDTGFPRPSQTDAAGQARDRRGSGQAGSRIGRLSTRGVAFLVLYCWLFAAGIMNTLAAWFLATGPSSVALTMISDVLWLLVAAIVLVIHSSLTSVPNQQPYRLAMLAMRGTLVLATVHQTLIFARWLENLRHPAWWSA
uniref:Uncharacterized protein n=1 Tax=Alexandrium monilatum TaxID=311494 RepID=A0A7S4RTK3_9DINO